jgi:putative selenate reductase
MRPVLFPELLDRIRGEYKNHGSVFGVRKEKFYRPAGECGRTTIFGSHISSPIGPAAGPNSQLAQNILASYLAGSRFVELKTVQVMDGAELRKAVPRPCINALDEGYNVEWSTELTVTEAQEEYIKAWFLCHIAAKEFGITETTPFAGDCVFNMSVGYSLEGIRSPKIDAYIEGMKNARDTLMWKSCYRYLRDHLGEFRRFAQTDLEAISPVISAGVTLSTLHGCPREEIEKIAAYLIAEKGLHTYIKCNPTLLGYDTARSLLDKAGYGYISFDDHHFKNDLQFGDAVEMLGRLMKLAREKGRSFGVKLTNTFPVEIRRNELPGGEMYMSGRPLFHLSINVAKKLSNAFNGELPISYSGGADFFNLRDILETGIQPVTVATTILKPGGYERLTQLAELAEKTLTQNRDASVPGGPAVINVPALNALADQASERLRYRKEYRHTGSRKTGSVLPLFDCAKAPCTDGGCPIHQRIPEYLAAVAAGNYRSAFAIIAQDNTAPSITGTICDHQCQNKCTRVDYEDPLEIRLAKRIAADHAQEAYVLELAVPPIRTDKTVAVIGAGPAGIAAAVFLRRNGVPVTVYETRERPYGIVQYVIPAFRISDDAIYRDFQLAEKLGVEFKFKVPREYSIAALRQTHEYLVIATGAWKEGISPVKQGQERVIDALKFLEDSKRSDCALDLGKRVAVIGGGDVAMDCARAAKRNKGVESVTIVYRRTREFMPAQYEEQESALNDGVEMRELLAPESFAGGILTCEKMRLGEYDASGRRGILGTGEKQALPFDTVIGAVGARVDTALLVKNGVVLNAVGNAVGGNAVGNAHGYPIVNEARESSLPGVYIAGDCKAGAATVVKAIADGKAAAADILRKLGLSADFTAAPGNHASAALVDFPGLYLKKGIIVEATKDAVDGYRCLSCNALCETCVDVCPNRANVTVEIDHNAAPCFLGTHQIVHLDRMCNECGNCATFCPHAGKPYQDKFTVFCALEDFEDSRNPGFLATGADTFKLRLKDTTVVDCRRGDANIPGEYAAMIDIIEKKYPYLAG